MAQKGAFGGRRNFTLTRGEIDMEFFWLILAGVTGALIGGALFEKTDIFAGSGLIGSLIVKSQWKI